MNPIDSKMIWDIRRGMGLTIQDAAAQAGISPVQWTAMEDPSKSESVRVVHLYAAAKVLRVDPRALLNDPDDNWLLVTEAEEAVIRERTGMD
jgi:transcriptional regulator with XRE-family HTH domain